jgi:GxxExxY protein
VFSVPSAATILMTDHLTQQIIGAAIEVHKILGCGLLESIYEEALCYEFELRSIAFKRQVEIDVLYKGKKIKGQKVDLLVDSEVVVEIKSLAKLPAVATAQTLSYLKATDLRRGLLINFGEKRLVDGVKRISL